MALHPEIARILATLPAPPPGPLDPVAMRADEESRVAPMEERLPLHAVEDRAAPTAYGDVPARVYTPTAEPLPGVLVYLHGGAFFLGSLETHDHVARALAQASGLQVVSVGYRRAPESTYPAGLEDCYGVVRWVGETLEPGQTIAVAGDSSGGTFVAAVTAMARDDGWDRITHQVLYYPSLDLDFDEERYASLRDNAVGYGLETAGLKPFNAFYLESGADPSDPLVSPIKRKDLTGLPPALVVTAELDPLRDEGELYAERLRAAGVDATTSRYGSAGHGFAQHFAWLPDFQGIYAQTAGFIHSRAGR